MYVYSFFSINKKKKLKPGFDEKWNYPVLLHGPPSIIYYGRGDETFSGLLQVPKFSNARFKNLYHLLYLRMSTTILILG